MSSAHRYSWKRADGSTGRAWRAKWTAPDGKPRSKRGFDRKADADAYGRDREAEARHGVVLEASDGMTLGRWAQEWLSTRRVRPSTAEAYRYAVQRITRDPISQRPLTALRRSELEAWRKSIDPPAMSPSTAQQTAAILGMILRAAVADDLIPRSPMPRQAGAAAKVVDPDELLTMEQVRAWSAAMPPHARAMPIVAALTGLRQGELLGLRTPNLEMLGRRIKVTEQLVSPPAGVPRWGPPKTSAGYRTVPLLDEAIDALAEHLAAFPPVDGVVFRSARGHLWRRQTFGEVWHQSARTAGLPEWAHWHGLRDFAISLNIRAGVDVKAVMDIAGHRNSNETLRTYARLWADSRDQARSQVNAFLAAQGQSGATGRADTL